MMLAAFVEKFPELRCPPHLVEAFEAVLTGIDLLVIDQIRHLTPHLVTLAATHPQLAYPAWRAALHTIAAHPRWLCFEDIAALLPFPLALVGEHTAPDAAAEILRATLAVSTWWP